MKKTLLLLTIVLIASIESAKAITLKRFNFVKTETLSDSLRLDELDQFWIELTRTVNDGDFEGYKSAYHEDAVVIFATGKNKISIPITKALANWKEGFIDTKAGKKNDTVEFRFSQRVGDETTAHETGIFSFKSTNNNGEITANAKVHFEMLLIRRQNLWLALMEYQKSEATQEEWEALK